MFHSIQPWQPKLTSNNKLAWVTCLRVPLEFSGEQCFSSIVRLFGSLVSLDAETVGMNRLDRARMLVRTPKSKILAYKYNAKINDEMFKVRFD